MVKKHSVSDTARTASLTDLRRWPGNGVFGMKPNSGSDALPHRIASGGFFGQNRKLQRSRKTDLGVERSPNPDLDRFSLLEKLLKSLLRPVGHGS